MKVYYAFIFCLGLISCNKKEFLDEKPRSDLFVPTTLEDFQALLDNDVVISLTPVLGELSADNYYVLQSSWSTLTTKEKNAYTWEKDTYGGEGKVVDWNTPYEQVLYANVVLEGLQKNVAKTPDNQQKWNAVRGGALFIRAYAFYNLAQVFALPYNAATANTDQGLPLKLSPNVDEKIQRSSLEQTYNQILTDLLEAKTLLPDTISNLRIRPNKPAAFALLARVYLSMRQYEKAGAYADSSLQLYKLLIDYNTRDANSTRPFDRWNVETMYQSRFVETNLLKGISGLGLVDTDLFNSYTTNDLRRSLFFYTIPGGKNFKGSYTGLIWAFTGLATDETYLIRAECKARAGNVTGAMTDLNTLLIQRWKTGTFVPFTATTWQEALDTILIQRRKELPCRGVRWTDIRRLNLEDPKIKPVRFINNQPYELPVNSSRYALPIPPDALQLGNYIQNERE